jgi:PAS domain S-box-containing protein
MLTSRHPDSAIQSALDLHPPLVAVDGNVPLAIAAMAEMAASYVLVVDRTQGDILVGILTERDLVRISLQSTPLDRLSIQVVMAPAIAISADATADLEAVMRIFDDNRGIRHLPILNADNRVVGAIDREILNEQLARQFLQSKSAAPTLDLVLADPHSNNVPSPAPKIFDLPQVHKQLQTLIEGTALTTGKDFFPALASHMAKALNVSYALVTEKIDDKLHVLAFWSIDGLQPTFNYPITATPCERVLQHGRYYCERLVQQQFPADLDLVEMAAQSYLGIALQDADGRSIGNLCILDRQPIQDPQKAESLLRVFAARAAAELERERATQALAMLNQNLEQRVAQRTIALAQSEHYYRALMESANDAILLTDTSGCLLEGNHRAEILLGYSLEELYSLDMSKIHPPAALADVRQHIAQMIQTDSDMTIETVVRHKNGTQIHVEISHSPIDLQGDLIIQSVFRDITDRKQMESLLAHSEAKFRRLVEGCKDLIWSSDGTRLFTYLSPQFKAIFGWEPSEWIGKSPLDLVHPEDRHRIVAAHRQDLLTGTTSSYQEFRHQHRDGYYVWVRNSIVSIFNDLGEVIGRDGILSDITDRKQAELALELEAMRLTAIFNASSDGIHIVDTSGNLIEANDRFAQMLGYTLPEIARFNITDWDAHWTPEEITDVLKDETFNNCIFETQHRRKDGSIFPAEISRQAMEWQGKVILVNTSRDISERKEYQQRLERSNAELLRATRLKDEFLANMSHELRTPLNAILGLSESLLSQMQGTINDRQKKYISTIERSGEHLLALINDILEVSKIEAGKLELELTTVSVVNLTKSSLSFIKQQAHNKQIQLDTTLAPNLGKIEVDERRIRQVLINLLNNGVKFTPEGGRVSLEVSLEECRSPSISTSPHLQDSTADLHWLLFSVSDTGIGITPENQLKLFQPFVQIDGSLNRQYQGTGLGLMLVKQIVELHGGSVSIASEFGRGSCFTVRLPYRPHIEDLTLSETPVLPEIDASQVSDLNGAQSQIEPPLILIAEDNQNNIDTLTSYLETFDYRMLIAKNGHEAIDFTKSHLPNLILMDIQMPCIDGLEAIQTIRQDPALAEIPIIALTALAMAGDREKCLAAGANEYITKPVKMKQLVMMIQKLLTAT